MKVILDTCILKLATLPNPINPAALIVELFLAGDLQAWASPAMIEEYQEVLTDAPELLQRILSKLELCYPLTEFDVIRHKPDNRFLESALAVSADFQIDRADAHPARRSSRLCPRNSCRSPSFRPTTRRPSPSSSAASTTRKFRPDRCKQNHKLLIFNRLQHFPAGKALLPAETRAIPAGKTTIPTGTGSIPAGMEAIPAGNVIIPTGIGVIPDGVAVIPAEMEAIPVGNMAIPTGKTSIPAPGRESIRDVILFPQLKLK